MDENIEIGRRLRQFGEDKFGTMAEFAKSLGILPQNLNQLLNGERRPGIRMQERLRNLGCPIEWLMYGETSAVTNAKYNYLVEKKWRENNPDKAKILDYLEGVGITNVEQLKALFNPAGIAEDVAAILQKRIEEVTGVKKK
ncbi:MAG: XRE family transcriptional regulator [Bacteroidetes bacterium]|nr:MAG: XRE family transcriptional regulator [Bacteroidota bacterium]